MSQKNPIPKKKASMEFLLSFLSIFGQVLISMYVIKKINNINFGRWILLGLTASFIIYFIGKTPLVIFSNIFLVLALLLYIYLAKVKIGFWHSIYTSTLTVLIVSLLSYFIYFALSFLIASNYSYLISIFLCSVLIQIILKLEVLNDLYYISLLPTLVTFFVIGTLGIFSFFHIHSKTSLLFFYILFFSIIMIFGYKLASFFIEVRIMRMNQETQIKYLKEVESLNDDLISFKHDYMNLLLTLKESIDENNYDDVKQIFNNTIFPTRDTIQDKQTLVEKYKDIKGLELRNLIMSKEIEANHNNCIFSLLTIGKIDIEGVDNIALIRCIAILIDNAIEAAKMNLYDKEISICLTKVENEFTFSCRNSIKGLNFDQDNFFKKEYTTKEISSNYSGIGLFSLKRIIDTNVQFSLSTEFRDDYIVQTLMVYI